MEIYCIDADELDDYVKKYADRIMFIVPWPNTVCGQPAIKYKLYVASE